MEIRSKAYWIIAGSILFLAGIIFLKLFLTKPEICDPNVKSKTVILIDKSEGVAKQTLSEVVNRSLELIASDQVKEGEKVSIFDISTDSKRNLQPIFEGCKPRATGNAVIENAKKVRRDFKKFREALEEHLSKEITGSTESPIAQAVTDISLNHKYFVSDDATHLVIFSDMVENTINPKFSLYSCGSGKDAIEKYRSLKTGTMVRPKFENVKIDLNLFPRAGMSKEIVTCRDLFWAWFFGDTTCKSAECLKSTYLPG
jgi:hypothetical protein